MSNIVDVGLKSGTQAALAGAQVAQAAAKHNNQKNPVMSSDVIKDRLEITELSDAEENGQQLPNQPMIPPPDYRRPRTPSSDLDANAGTRSNNSGSHHGKILDIPSGLY